jgi:hypothetical protein
MEFEKGMFHLIHEAGKSNLIVPMVSGAKNAAG